MVLLPIPPLVPLTAITRGGAACRCAIQGALPREAAGGPARWTSRYLTTDSQAPASRRQLWRLAQGPLPRGVRRGRTWDVRGEHALVELSDIGALTERLWKVHPPRHEDGDGQEARWA